MQIILHFYSIHFYLTEITCLKTKQCRNKDQIDVFFEASIFITR